MKHWVVVTAAILLSVGVLFGWHQRWVEDMTAAVTPGLGASAMRIDASTDANPEWAAPTPIVPADASDESVIRAVNELAPQMVQWLTPSDQVRKWVALVNQLANGRLPQFTRPLEYLVASFQVEHRNHRLTMTTASYRRADWLIGVITDISTKQLAGYYHVWQPYLNAAYRQLGETGAFDKRLRAAIERVLAVKPLATTPELRRSGVYYVYADPNLEQASDLEKLCWRMGPDNTRHLQSYLRQLEPKL